MKTLKRFIVVSIWLAVESVAMACGPFYYSAADNRIYRLPESLLSHPLSVTEDFVGHNIRAWSRQTGFRDTAAIRRALYTDWDNFGDWEGLLREMRSAAAQHNSMTENAFCRHLVATNDTDAVRLLCWSKTYANIRNSQRSPWYYNSRVENDEVKQLRTLYEQLLRYKPSRKYADRYAFLSIKCAWALGEDSATVALWNRSPLRQKSNLFHYEAGDYVARCLTREGCHQEADALYRESQGVEQLIPWGASLPTQLSIRLSVNPNDYRIAELLQDYLGQMDREQAATYRWDGEWDRFMVDSVVAVAHKALDNPRVRHKAMWRYAAACALDYTGRPQEALTMLKGAEGGDGDAQMRKSVRILMFYLRARTEWIDDDFERYAIGEMMWLDNEMVREWNRLPDSVRLRISHIDDWRWMCATIDMEFYSAMRRIVLQDSVGLAWRLLRDGRGVRALQMANVADNHLINLSDNIPLKRIRELGKGVYHVWYFDKRGQEHNTVLTDLRDTVSLEGSGFGGWYSKDNSHDYSNGLFCLVDRVSAHTLEVYRNRQLHPQDLTDKWFNVRSYTDGDYWQDIVGTHYLRERNYRAAVAHLRHVSPKYQQRMNISCSIDPFSLDLSQESHDTTHYKLCFAMRMDSLQRTMRRDSDADRRGLAMLEYTIGLENSFGMCWWLTSYAKGWVGPDLTDIEETPYAHKAQAVVTQLRKKAFATLCTDEACARYHLRLGHYAIVRKRYANTTTGRYVALVCDSRKHYRSQILPKKMRG